MCEAGHGPLASDVEYYTRLLASVSGLILAPAAGTGRMLIPLLEAGHAVEGLDSSPERLELCRQHCRDLGLDPVLREADMTIYVRLAAYQAVIIPAGSIALLDGRKATLQALTCFRDSLVPGGLLIMDVPVPQPAAANEAMRYWRELLSETGFGDIAMTGDYQDTCAPGPGNKVWTFRATRPAALAPGTAPGTRAPAHR